MLIDPHVHTSEHSRCSSFSVFLGLPELCSRLKRGGIGGIVLTEHNATRTTDKMKQVQRMAGPKFRVLQGVEFGWKELREAGEWPGWEILVYGLDASVDAQELRSWGPTRCLEYTDKVGCANVVAHPFRYKKHRIDIDKLFSDFPIHAVERANGNCSREANKLAEAEHPKLPGIGGSDAHSCLAVGRVVTEVLDGVSSGREFAEAIRAGKVIPVRPFEEGGALWPSSPKEGR